MEVRINLFAVCIKMCINKDNWGEISLNGEPLWFSDLAPCSRGYSYGSTVQTLDFDINIDTGKIFDWKEGNQAVYNCTVSGIEMFIYDEHNSIVRSKFGQLLSSMAGEKGDDNLSFKVGKDGIIEGWNFDFSETTP